MADYFTTPKAAARALIDCESIKLDRRSGHFLGGVLFDRDDPDLSDKQLAWLVGLLARAGLPPLATEETHD